MLSAVGATSTGAGAIINEEVFAAQITETITNAIDKKRARIRKEITSIWGGSSYEMADAIIEVQNYHNACSLMAGLTEIESSLNNHPQTRRQIDAE